MLEDIRRVTLKGINGLTKEQLFGEPLPGEFCIGAYLIHLGECDLGWLKVMDGKEPSEELKKKTYYDSWFDSGKNFNPPKEPLEVEEYIGTISKCRQELLDYMMTLDDAVLDQKFTVVRNYDGKEVTKEYTRKWIIYHLIEHEAHTRGQMFMLMRMAGFKKKGENN